VASRRRILDAAAEIAGERGYAGTSISEVSKRSGLPHSSIYWHFADKDALFAAVIEDSYEQWRADFQTRNEGSSADAKEVLVRLHDSLATFPAFLRFGHLVILERHEQDLTARTRFLEIRERALADLADRFVEFDGIDRRAAAELAALALALIDGAFLARAAGEPTLNGSAVLGRAFQAAVGAVREPLSSVNRPR
jgi:AcrR family transcriptional regulator